tara:strand:- start:125 stop:289 length:165 start_codon:yes stop_codon:yes gene_type:complete
MNVSKKIFFNKKILIYGIGKSGLSSYKFLKKTIIFIYMMMIKKSLKKNLLKNYY